MSFFITIKDANDKVISAYTATGNRDDLQDAAYKVAGALGVTVMRAA